MNKELVEITEKPKLPANWDYDKSVDKVKSSIYKWKDLTVGIVSELYIAREKLSSTGGHPFHKEVRGTKVPCTWSDYCLEIELAKGGEQYHSTSFSKEPVVTKLEDLGISKIQSYR